MYPQTTCVRRPCQKHPSPVPTSVARLLKNTQPWAPRHARLPVCAQPCLTLCSPMDCSLPGSSVHGILQARMLEWIAISSSFLLTQGSNSHLLHLPHCRRFFTTEPLGTNTILKIPSPGLHCTPTKSKLEVSQYLPVTLMLLKFESRVLKHFSPC